MANELYILWLTFLAVSALNMDKLIDGNKKFAAKLYREVAKDNNNGNFIFCPINVQIMLAALSSADLSGRSPGAKKIRQAAELPDTNAETEDYIGQLVSNDLNQTAEDDFKIFNVLKLYYKNNIQISQKYQQLLKTKYGADIESIDFSNKNAINIINSWILQKTINQIQNFFPDGSLPTWTQTILINILDLTGKWLSPFDETKNERLPFWGVSKKVFTDMMVLNETSFYYYSDRKAQYLQMKLDTYETACNVIFVLPIEPNTIEDIENDEIFESKKFILNKMFVKLPKYKISSDLNIKKMLSRMGLGEVFQLKYGEFSGLAISGHPWVGVTDILQKATIKVDAGGIAASSAIASLVYADKPLGLDEHSFIADRPFLFYVELNDLVLFAGRVVQL